MISFDFHHLGAFFRPELSHFPPCSPSFEGAILDSKLENVGYIVMLRARLFRSLIIRTGIKERNIRARNITI